MHLSPFKAKCPHLLGELSSALRPAPGFLWATSKSAPEWSQLWPNTCPRNCSINCKMEQCLRLREEQGVKPFFAGFKKWEGTSDRRQENLNSLSKIRAGDQMVMEKLKKIFKTTLRA